MARNSIGAAQRSKNIHHAQQQRRRIRQRLRHLARPQRQRHRENGDSTKNAPSFPGSNNTSKPAAYPNSPGFRDSVQRGQLTVFAKAQPRHGRHRHQERPLRRPQHDVAEEWNEEQRRYDALHRASEPATSTHSLSVAPLPAGPRPPNRRSRFW